MGVVKYSGPVASFHCPTEATIRSLKVHFSPKQLGSGTPSPENVREIVGWDGVEVYDYTKTDINTSIIPSEYRKVEYIEGTGTQWINTQVAINIAANVETNWLLRFAITNFERTQILAGVNANYKQVPVLNRKIRQDWAGTTSKYFPMVMDVGTIYTVGQKNNEFYLESESIEIASTAQTNIGFALFAKVFDNGSPEESTIASMRAYGFTMDTNGNPVRNMIPCVRKSDNKPGMYDTVSQTFYTNSGTGEFLYGPEVNGYTENYEFGVLGKNKLNNDNEFWEVGSMDAGGGKDSRTTRIRTKDFIPVLPNTVYTISISEGYSFAWDEFYSGIHKHYYDWQSGSYTYITSSDINQLFFIIKKDNTTDITPSILENDCHIQLELGSTATAYEPYDPNKTVYGGWVDLITGEVAQTYNSINLGSVNWIKYSNADNDIKGIFISREITGMQTSQPRPQVYCSSYAWNRANVSQLEDLQISDSYQTKLQSVMIRNLAQQDLTESEFKSFVNGLILYFPLETPITYQLAPTSLQTFLSQNNIWSNADYVEVEYDLHETQNILARKQFIIANQPHVEKLAAAPLQNFETDMAAPIKECKIHFSPVQEGSGDPSPENVRAINGWTGLTAYRSEENLIPANLNWTSKKMKTTGGIITGSVYNCFWFPVPKGTIYFHKRNSSVGIAYMAFIDKEPEIGDVVYGAVTLSSYTNYTFDNSDGHPYAIICGPTGTRTETASEYCSQNEICVTATHFRSLEKYPEPYTGTTLPIDWTTEAGTVYGGYVDLVTGEIWKEWYLYKLPRLKDSNCTIASQYYIKSDAIDLFVYPPTDLRQYPSEGATFIAYSPLCNRLDFKPKNIWSTVGYPNCWTLNGGQIHFNISNDLLGITDYTQESTTTAKVKVIDYMNSMYDAGNYFEFAYKIKPTLLTTLTPTQLKTLRGTNNIWASNGGDNIEIAYWKH